MTEESAARHVLVAGGSSGIGLGIAQGFAQAGATVSIIGRNPEKLEQARQALLSAGGEQVLTCSVDVREGDNLHAAIAGLIQQSGELNVLVAAQAGNFPAYADSMSERAFRAVVDIDLVGTFNLLRACAQSLRQVQGTAIMISAPQAFVAMPLQSHVGAAKAGVEMLTRDLALEWGPKGVRVNAIVPGPIADTEGMRRLAPTEQLTGMVAGTVPLGRLGQVIDISNAALFLASPQAGYINGAILPVDGGWSLAGAGSAAAMLEQAFARAKKDN